MIFQQSCLPPDVAARLEADRELVRALRVRIARRIERDIMILDALSPDADLEDGADDEPSLGSINPTLGQDPLGCGMHQGLWSTTGTDDREAGDDNGIADKGGLEEQQGQVWFGSADELDAVYGDPLVQKDGRLVPAWWA